MSRFDTVLSEEARVLLAGKPVAGQYENTAVLEEEIARHTGHDRRIFSILLDMVCHAPLLRKGGMGTSAAVFAALSETGANLSDRHIENLYDACHQNPVKTLGVLYARNLGLVPDDHFSATVHPEGWSKESVKVDVDAAFQDFVDQMHKPEIHAYFSAAAGQWARAQQARRRTADVSPPAMDRINSGEPGKEISDPEVLRATVMGRFDRALAAVTPEKMLRIGVARPGDDVKIVDGKCRYDAFFYVGTTDDVMQRGQVALTEISDHLRRLGLRLKPQDGGNIDAARECVIGEVGVIPPPGTLPDIPSLRRDVAHEISTTQTRGGIS